MLTNRFKILFWWLTSIFWSITLLYICLQPAPFQLAGPLGWDKLQHAGAFGLLAYFIFKTLRLQSKSLVFTTCLAFFTASILGGLIELLQEWYTTNRTGDLFDFFADATGSMLVTCFLYFKSK